MKKILTLAAALLVGFSGSAHAITSNTLDVLLGATSTSETFTVGGPAATPNVNLSTLSSSQLSLTNAAIVSGSVSGQYTQPTGSIYGGKYLAVFGNPYGFGVASITLNTAPTDNVFGFTWGSPDSYNYLIVTDSRNFQYIISGSQIISLIGGQANLVITDPFGSIKTAQFFTTSNSFETANFSEKHLASLTTPLPASLGLFLAALGGLFFLRRKQII